MREIAGRTAFITGGAQGIGLGIARALAREGAALAIADIDTAALAAAEAELGARTAVRGYRLDVRDRAAYAAVADAAEADLGPVSLLVNNAGVGLGVLQTLSAEITYATWDYVVGVNLGGVNNGVQTFLPRMLERGTEGHILTTASAAGLVVFPERSSGYTYHASKFAVIGLTEALRRGLDDEGLPIGAGVLIPGMVATGVGANSVRWAPDGSVTRDVRATAERGDAALARYGRDIDSVGALAVEGIRRNRLYLPTDRLAAEALARRTADIVAAMPAPADVHDHALATAMRRRADGSS
jgi:NAD(P)-dependent dehydrogenase (short-subunit alcohol dehydrogenase family)